MVAVGEVSLCVQTAGSPEDPAILLINGACASMLWWEAELCDQLTEQGRYVIRYDQRDTGRSTSFPVGDPGYAMSDLARDAVGVLDGLGVERAHIVGRSMSGGVALMLGVDHPDRVVTLTFLSTSTGEADLAPPTREFRAATAGDPTDLRDRSAAVEHVAALIRAYYGTSTMYDEEAVRELVVADIARTVDLEAALTNHFAMTFDPPGGGFGDIAVPTLVIHGELDPAFPLDHGRALQRAIPGAELLVLEGAGHELPRQLWDVFVPALVRHTANAGAR